MNDIEDKNAMPSILNKIEISHFLQFSNKTKKYVRKLITPKMPKVLLWKKQKTAYKVKSPINGTNEISLPSYQRKFQNIPYLCKKVDRNLHFSKPLVMFVGYQQLKGGPRPIRIGGLPCYNTAPYPAPSQICKSFEAATEEIGDEDT